jgi:hypothetical protein
VACDDPGRPTRAFPGPLPSGSRGKLSEGQSRKSSRQRSAERPLREPRPADAAGAPGGPACSGGSRRHSLRPCCRDAGTGAGRGNARGPEREEASNEPFGSSEASPATGPFGPAHFALYHTHSRCPVLARGESTRSCVIHRETHAVYAILPSSLAFSCIFRPWLAVRPRALPLLPTSTWTAGSSPPGCPALGARSGEMAGLGCRPAAPRLRPAGRRRRRRPRRLVRFSGRPHHRCARSRACRRPKRPAEEQPAQRGHAGEHQ